MWFGDGVLQERFRWRGVLFDRVVGNILIKVGLDKKGVEKK